MLFRSGTCNPEGTQRSLSMWLELNDGVDPAIIDKILKAVKHIGVKIEEVYQKPERAKDEW